MSETEGGQFIDQLVTDFIFRERFRHDLDSACHEEGFVLTEVELHILQRKYHDTFSPLADFLPSANGKACLMLAPWRLSRVARQSWRPLGARTIPFLN